MSDEYTPRVPLSEWVETRSSGSTEPTAASGAEAMSTPTDNERSAVPNIEVMAEAVHNAYLETCARLGWPVKESNNVPYAELSEDSKELDRASVRAVLHSGELSLVKTAEITLLKRYCNGLTEYPALLYTLDRWEKGVTQTTDHDPLRYPVHEISQTASTPTQTEGTQK
jgi:hypothetical protein